MEIDFDKIVLNKSEKSVMKKLSRHKQVKINDNVATSLGKSDFIERCYFGVDEYGEPIFNGHFTISYKGERYWLYRKSITKSKRTEWIRYIITTFIAVIALVIASISLYLQYV